ncbi:uncharacterized protein JCM6883_002960 [Sporobolomyces salmoneus]|uniref:uncharacterized protein n=1 Tax=Sporobolomyces salmoneus TaxID=183962 RepID=UPI0031747AC6
MPIPFIPPELVSVILSHFLGGDDQVLQDVGESAALVCRSWRPLGQALRWSKISIEPSSSSSLLDHLVAHPHIAKFVQELVVKTFHPAEEEVDDEHEDYAPSLKLISELSELRNLDLEVSNPEHVEESLIVCSRLQKLEEFRLFAWTLRINCQLEITLREGFPALSTLTLRPLALIRVNNYSFKRQQEEAKEEKGKKEATLVSISSKRQLRQIKLLTEYPDDEDAASVLFGVVKSAFDCSQISNYSLGGPFLAKEILLALARLPNLKELRIFPANCRLEDLFTVIVDVLPHMNNVEILLVSTSWVEDNSFESPLGIRDFLKLIPSNLKWLVLPQIAFDSDDFAEFPTEAELAKQGKNPGRILVSLAKGNQALTLFEHDAGSGKEWCRGNGLDVREKSGVEETD